MKLVYLNFCRIIFEYYIIKIITTKECLNNVSKINAINLKNLEYQRYQTENL